MQNIIIIIIIITFFFSVFPTHLKNERHVLVSETIQLYLLKSNSIRAHRFVIQLTHSDTLKPCTITNTTQINAYLILSFTIQRNHISSFCFQYKTILSLEIKPQPHWHSTSFCNPIQLKCDSFLYFEIMCNHNISITNPTFN